MTSLILVRCGGIQTGSPAKSDAERCGLFTRSLRAAQRDFTEFDTHRTPAEEVAKVVCRAERASPALALPGRVPVRAGGAAGEPAPAAGRPAAGDAGIIAPFVTILL